MSQRDPLFDDILDCLRTFGEAAELLGVRYHVVQRAARRRLVPIYRLGTSRPYVKLRDLLKLASSGGEDE